MMKNILIIEDESAHFDKMKDVFNGLNVTFKIYPEINNDKETNLNNRGYMMDMIIKNKSEDNLIFESIVENYSNIDLFIVDAVLANRVSQDRKGIEFLNYLQQINYRFGNYQFIITSGHNYEKLGNMNFDFNPELNYVSKAKWGNFFPREILKLSLKLLNINNDSVNQINNTGIQLLKFYDKDEWITLTDKIEKHAINRIILVVTYIIVITTSIYAFWEILNDTIHVFFKAKASVTDYLEYVEHIYLFILPLFIVLSFLLYYKSTIEIKLTGGYPDDIDHKGALNLLENSKQILFSSILTFTIIKIIEKVFVDNMTNLINLITYGIILLILMFFTIFQHK